MKKDNPIYLEHILESLAKIEHYTEGMEERDFDGNELVQDGVIRQFEIIGEATKQLGISTK